MPRHPTDLSRGVKRCPGCKTEKQLTEFHRSADTIHGYQVYCKDCQRERHKQYRADKKPKFAEISRNWRQKNRERSRDHMLTAAYGLPIGTYARMLTKQDGKCAICGATSPRGNGERFHVDHCHDTGKIRGLLCHSCNVGIGSLKHSEAILLAAIKYLRLTEGS